MKSLAERHEERARRKAENRSERDGAPRVSAAAAILVAQQAASMFARLPESERGAFEDAMRGFDPSADISLAENERGDTMAGIGVVNTKVVPASAEGGNGGGVSGWVDTPETPDLEGSNLNGKALESQTEGGDKTWSNKPAKTPTKGDSKPEPAKGE